MSKKISGCAAARPREHGKRADMSHEEGSVHKITDRAGAILLPNTLRKQTGGWIKQEFDAQFDWFGIKWLRVKDGMGGEGRREDWVADVPVISISVHDYQWNGDDFGANHGSFTGAIRAETKLAIRYAKDKKRELLATIENLNGAIDTLEAAIKKSTRSSNPINLK